jgi:hypothetical protein
MIVNRFRLAENAFEIPGAAMLLVKDPKRSSAQAGRKAERSGAGRAGAGGGGRHLTLGLVHSGIRLETRMWCFKLTSGWVSHRWWDLLVLVFFQKRNLSRT